MTKNMCHDTLAPPLTRQLLLGLLWYLSCFCYCGPQPEVRRGFRHPDPLSLWIGEVVGDVPWEVAVEADPVPVNILGPVSPNVQYLLYKALYI